MMTTPGMPEPGEGSGEELEGGGEQPDMTFAKLKAELKAREDALEKAVAEDTEDDDDDDFDPDLMDPYMVNPDRLDDPFYEPEQRDPDEGVRIFWFEEMRCFRCSLCRTHVIFCF